MKDSLQRVAVIVFLLTTLIFNALANIIPFNGLTTGGVSDGIPSLFTPAGYVFGIWGVIYLALMLYAVYQALDAQRDNPRLRKIGWWFVVSCAANMAWLFCWHYLLFPLSMLAMLVLLASLMISYHLLETGRSQVSLAEPATKLLLQLCTQCVQNLLPVISALLLQHVCANASADFPVEQRQARVDGSGNGFAGREDEFAHTSAKQRREKGGGHGSERARLGLDGHG